MCIFSLPIQNLDLFSIIQYYLNIYISKHSQLYQTRKFGACIVTISFDTYEYHKLDFTKQYVSYSLLNVKLKAIIILTVNDLY